MKMNWFAVGALAGAAGVSLGAFGAHAMTARLPEQLLDAFEIAVRYQMYHALALLAVGWAATRHASGWTDASGWLFLVGIVVFCGSLYLMALTGARWLGAITPIGGACLILGWIALAATALRSGH